MIPLRDEATDIGVWTMAIDAALFVQKLFDHVRVGYDESRISESFEGVDTPILFSPLCESTKSQLSPN
jgi:hypothetical protein